MVKDIHNFASYHEYMVAGTYEIKIMNNTVTLFGKGDQFMDCFIFHSEILKSSV